MEPGQVGVRVPSPLAGYTYASEDDFRAALELARREAVAERRRYHRGSQVDTDNAQCLAQLGVDAARTGEKGLARWIHDRKLPEHYRLHAYSTQIEEAVEYLTHRLCVEFAIEATSPGVQEVIDRCLDASPELSGTADDDEYSVANLVREALLAGDCPVRVRLDAAAGQCWLEPWPSDAVRLDFTDPRSDRPTFVALWETYWRPDDAGQQHQVTIRREWRVEWYAYPGPGDVPDGPITGPVTWQCVESWWEEHPGGDDVLLQRSPTGVPFVPWGLLRGSRRGLRAERGESIVSDRAMRTADRLDAVLQHSWLACRHNSHATLGVVGDNAMLQSKSDQVIHKDIADAVVFPGGTALTPLVLPTDTALIEHQRSVLLDALFGCFGLARVDQSTLQGLGQVTGYALEILNGKTESTFDAARIQARRDWKALLNTVLDCHAHWMVQQLDTDPVDVPAAVVAGLAVDPLAVFPDRAMEVRTGTGEVVDIARLRDDYVAGLLPLTEVWRLMGYTDDEIERLRREMDEQETARAERENRALGGVEGGQFSAPAPRFGVVGGASSTPPGTPGGVTNNPGDGPGRVAG